jgi:acid stress-induced BolA-like protein IbaG/YrbA
MSPDEIKQILKAGMEADHIEVSGDGRHFDVLIVSQVFEGLRPVKKQQLVYAVLQDKIADGSLHAVNMQTLTPAEYATRR